jgi:REP element-mobilizing transposase RayT
LSIHNPFATGHSTARATPAVHSERFHPLASTALVPRQLPIVRAASWYHVVNRGVDDSSLFPTPEARNGFVSALERIAYDFAVELHAYCAMESHYHALARAEESELRRAFEELDIECRLTTDGARFRSMVFGRHMLQVTRYIHRNPVEAGLVPRPGDWRWSSYRAYVDPRHAPPWLRTAAVLGCLGSIGGRQRYRRYVEVDINMSRPYVMTYEDHGASR